MSAPTVRWIAPREIAHVQGPDGWSTIAEEDAVAHGADAALVVEAASGARARASLWWSATPVLDGLRIGAIGHYASADAAASRALLDAAATRLASEGCGRALGPMDGNTWRRYRLVTERGTEPPYFMEPWNPQAWPAYWTDAGFAPLAQYYSAINENLLVRDDRVEPIAQRLGAAGITLRSLSMRDFDAELRRIFSVAEVSFRKNFLYTPIPQSAFAAQYEQIKRLVIPELVLIAERAGQPVGFAFSIPDALEAVRGETRRTVIIKTLAVLPDRERLAGLGTWLTESTHAVAHRLGFTRAIHALMHESNASRRISGHSGRPMRRYALYARPLA